MFHPTSKIQNPKPKITVAAFLLATALNAAPTDTNATTTPNPDTTTTTNTNTTTDNLDLGTITVTAADRVSTPLRDTTANVTVISAEEIKERGYQTVAEAVSRVSGFASASNGGPGQTSGLFLRGFNSGNILVMIDGVPLKDPTDPSFSTGLSHLLLDNVARIEVVKGAQSGIWGADAVAGVINIVTKEAKPGGHVSLRGSYGSYETWTGGITLSASGEAGSFLLSGDHFKTDGFSALRPRDAEADGYTNDTLDVKGRLNISPDSSLGIFYHQIDGDFDYDSGNPDDSLSNGTFQDHLTGLDYRYDDGKLSVKGLISLNTIDRHMEDANWGPSDYHGTDTRGTLNAFYSYDEHQRFGGGIEYNKIEGTYPDYHPWPPVQSTSAYSNRAVFGNYRYIWDELLGARTIFNATLRYDEFNVFDDKVTYRFGLKRECNLLPGFFTSANIYSAYKAPSIYQWTRPQTGITLKPEYTKGYEISAGYRGLIKVTYFRNRMTDRIVPGGSWPNDFYYNSSAKETLDGLEVEGTYHIDVIDTTISANFTHMFTMKDELGQPLLRIPQNTANFFVDYYLSDTIHLGANVQYIGKRTDQDWSSWSPIDVELGSYTLVNLSYNQKIGANFTLSVQAHNIFDEDYETAYGYSTEGRSVYAKMEYQF